MLPEEKARVKIDKQLNNAGWDIVDRQDYTTDFLFSKQGVIFAIPISFSAKCVYPVLTLRHNLLSETNEFAYPSEMLAIGTKDTSVLSSILLRGLIIHAV